MCGFEKMDTVLEVVEHVVVMDVMYWKSMINHWARKAQSI